MSHEKDPYEMVFRKQTEVLVRLGELPGRQEIRPRGADGEGAHLVHAARDSLVLELGREMCAQGQMLAVFLSIRAQGLFQEIEITAEVVELHLSEHEPERAFVTLRLVGFDQTSWGALISILEEEQEYLERALKHFRD